MRVGDTGIFKLNGESIPHGNGKLSRPDNHMLQKLRNRNSRHPGRLMILKRNFIDRLRYATNGLNINLQSALRIEALSMHYSPLLLLDETGVLCAHRRSTKKRKEIPKYLIAIHAREDVFIVIHVPRYFHEHLANFIVSEVMNGTAERPKSLTKTV